MLLILCGYTALNYGAVLASPVSQS